MPRRTSPEFLRLQQVIAGRYSIERELGRGGMGIVFLARDVALDRPVAIKLLPPELAANPELRDRFLREARTAAGLSHPNVVPIHLVEQHDDLVFFVMAYVDGETLGQRVRRAGPLPVARVSKILREVAWALAYAHGRGVIHRDIKPDNILLDKDSGRALVTDFGIARVAGTATTSRAGEIIGTVSYMSPEQASGEELDGRSDLFALGVTGYFALAGELPFDGPSLKSVVAQILTAEPPPLERRRSDVPDVLARVVTRCLRKSPHERFESGEAVAAALATTAQSGELAPELRHLLKTARDLDGPLALLALGVLMFQPLQTSGSADDFRSYAFAMALFVVLPTVFSVMALLHAMRRVVRAGFSVADVQRASAHARAAALEEARAVGLVREDSDDQLHRRMRRWRVLGHVSAGAIAAVAVGAGLGIVEPRIAPALVALLAILSFLFYGVSYALRRQLGQTSAPGSSLGWGERMLGTRAARWLFALAGKGLRARPQNEPPARDRTEVLLASAVAEVFGRLSPELRQRFAAVVPVAARLEAHATALRARDRELGQAASAVGPLEGRPESRRQVLDEIERSRHQVRERLASAVTALENLRLDLLRLQLGTGSPDELTINLERAAAIGESVEAQLQGQRSVDHIVAGRRTG